MPVKGIALPSPCMKFLAQCSHTHHHLHHHHHHHHHHRRLRLHHHRLRLHHHHHFNTLRHELPRLIRYVWDSCCITRTWHAFTSLEIKSVADHRVTGADFLVENGCKRRTSNYYTCCQCVISLHVYLLRPIHT